MSVNDDRRRRGSDDGPHAPRPGRDPRAAPGGDPRATPGGDPTRRYTRAPDPSGRGPQAWSQVPGQQRQGQGHDGRGARVDGVQYAPRQTPQPWVDDDPRYGRARSPGPPPGGPPPGPPPGPPQRYGQPQPPPKKRRRRRKSRARRWLTRLGLLVLVLVVALGALMLYFDRSLHRVDALADYPGRVAQTEGTNWLIVGSDSRYGLTEEQQSTLNTGGDVGDGRTDTILLMHTGSGTPTMVSIPRDSYVGIPGQGMDKINAAFAIGGPQLLVRTVESATGLHIDHYAEIGFGGFAGVVDAVGGLNLCLDRPVNDPAHGISLPGGCHKYQGPQALDFVRERYALPGSDLDRMANQRQFIDALASKIGQPTTWLNPVRMWNVTSRTVSSLTVDEGTHIWNLAALAWALKSGPVTTTVPIAGFENTSSGNAVRWDHQRASAFFEDLAHDRPLPDSLVTVNGFG